MYNILLTGVRVVLVLAHLCGTFGLYHSKAGKAGYVLIDGMFTSVMCYLYYIGSDVRGGAE